jgi:hypothetical protein
MQVSAYVVHAGKYRHAYTHMHVRPGVRVAQDMHSRKESNTCKVDIFTFMTCRRPFRADYCMPRTIWNMADTRFSWIYTSLMVSRQG